MKLRFFAINLRFIAVKWSFFAIILRFFMIILRLGAIFRYDGMAGSLKPWNVTVETLYYTDGNGIATSKQIIVPPP